MKLFRPGFNMINTKLTFCLLTLIYRNSSKATITEIYNLDNAKEFELVRLDYTDAKSGLISAARGHAEKIVLRLVARHRLDTIAKNSCIVLAENFSKKKFKDPL